MKTTSTFRYIATAFICLTSSLAFSNESSTTSAAKVFASASPSVVIIESGNSSSRSQGSGVVFGNGYLLEQKSTWVFTNAHVVGENPMVQIRIGNTSHKGIVEYKNSKLDLAVIFAEDVKLPPVSRRYTPSKPAIGDKVFAIGAPKGLEKTITDGIISSLRSEGGINYIQTSAAISPGSSGGGLFSETGEFIGITTFKIVGGDSLNFAISVNHGYEILESVIAAKMIRTAYEISFGESSGLGDEFVDWLSRVNIKSGRKNIELFAETSEKLQHGEFKGNRPAYISALSEIGAMYISEHKSGNSGKSIIASTPTEKKVLTLVCDMQFQTGRTDRMTIKIDFDAKTVDGYSAKFYENNIEYSWSASSGTTYYHSLDRVSSYLKIHTVSQPGFGGGACRRVEGLCCTKPKRDEFPLTPGGFMPQAPSQDGPVG